MRVVRHVVLALVAAVLLAGCGNRQITIPSAPVLVGDVEQDVRAGAIKALGILESAGQVILRAKAVAAKVAVPPNVRAEIDRAFVRVADAGIAAVNRIEQGAIRDWPSLRREIEPVLTQVEALARMVQAASGQGSTVDVIDAALDILRAGLKALPGGQPALAFGGLR